MTATVTPEAAERAEQSPRRSRGLLAAVAVLAVLAVGLAVALAAVVAGDDGSDAVPDDVQVVLDDYLAARSADDFDALQSVVTTNYRDIVYGGDQFGNNPFRRVFSLEYWETHTKGDPVFEIEQVGDPIVRGDGPWYVSIAENWKPLGSALVEQGISTYVVVVDTDDVLRIDDVYWAGHGIAADSS